MSEQRTSNPVNCGHLRVYHASMDVYEERQGDCVFCQIERLTAELATERMCHESASRANHDHRAERDRLREENAALINDNSAGCMSVTQVTRENARLRAALETIRDYRKDVEFSMAISTLQRIAREALAGAADETNATPGARPPGEAPAATAGMNSGASRPPELLPVETDAKPP